VKTSLGFSLIDLLCGSEGRLGVILNADVRLRARPVETAFLMAAFATESTAMEFVGKVKVSNITPKCCEIIDAYAASLVNFPLHVSGGGAVLIFEFDGSSEEVAIALRQLQQLDLNNDWVSARDSASREGLWAKRKGITHELRKRFAFKLGEDIAVPLTALAHIAEFARSGAATAGVKTAIWGHAGDGNLHVNYLFEKEDDLPVLEKLMLQLAQETTRVGGAISGEHGLGRLKKKFARAVLSENYFTAQQNIKTAFDPECIFNPALEQS
jgi:FAD/FMN-containing dehydrogenase